MNVCVCVCAHCDSEAETKGGLLWDSSVKSINDMDTLTFIHETQQ